MQNISIEAKTANPVASLTRPPVASLTRPPVASLTRPPVASLTPVAETHITLFVHPTSANAMYRAMGRRVVISAEGRAFKKLMAELLSSTPHGYITGPVKLTLAFEFMTNRKRDLDNYAKPLIDTLKGVLFVDDSDIYILNMTKRIGAAVDCVRIECVPIYEDMV